jgi:hypothetical protein
MQRLGGCGDIAEQSGSGLQIPVRIGDVRVSEIGAQCCHVSRNSSAIIWTLLQRPHRECVSEIVNATARLSGTGAQTNRSGQDEKGCNDGGIGKLAPAPGNEEGGGGWSQTGHGPRYIAASCWRALSCKGTSRLFWNFVARITSPSSVRSDNSSFKASEIRRPAQAISDSRVV